MTVARTIFAFVVAISVAILPTWGSFAIAAHSPVTLAAHCGDHQGMPHPSGYHGSPVDKAKIDCGEMAACSMHCFAIYPVSSSPGHPVFAAAIEPSFSNHTFRPQVGYPPFRPPRA
jgi:hypothetical protein